MQFRQRSQKNFALFPTLLSQSLKKKIFFSKKTMFSKSSRGLFQRQFGHPAKNVLLKIPEKFDPNPKHMEKKF